MVLSQLVVSDLYETCPIIVLSRRILNHSQVVYEILVKAALLAWITDIVDTFLRVFRSEYQLSPYYIIRLIHKRIQCRRTVMEGFCRDKHACTHLNWLDPYNLRYLIVHNRRDLKLQNLMYRVLV